MMVLGVGVASLGKRKPQHWGRDNLWLLRVVLSTAGGGQPKAWLPQTLGSREVLYENELLALSKTSS